MTMLLKKEIIYNNDKYIDTIAHISCFLGSPRNFYIYINHNPEPKNRLGFVQRFIKKTVIFINHKIK